MNAAANDLVWKKFPVLDEGFVTLVDVMGDDAAIVQAARVSFGVGTKTVSGDRDLIRYLMRKRHTTPFEMAEVKLLLSVPMDAWRQYIRHRTASVNEYSTRYSEAIDQAQRTDPGAWRAQAAGNKQGSGGFVIEWAPGYDVDCSPSGDDSVSSDYETPGHYLTDRERELQRLAREVYEERLKFGVAREQARKDLPLSTYTQAYWKCDLHNVLHFLALRMDEHAQLEIRSYAEVIGREIVAKLFPLTWEAFEDYRLGATVLSAIDATVVRHVAAGCDPGRALEELIANKREREECREKLVRLGLAEGGAA